ncbi:MAG TPA: hypothetical protein VIL97_07335 [Thermoanaerobaculia bacterium]
MSNNRDHVRAHIELAIERAREGVSEGIDEIDRRLRTSLDFKEIAADHAPQLLVAGAIFGFLLGFGVPRVMTRALGLGIPILLAVRIAKKKRQDDPAA